ncbi:methyl-accepting chemotaxis protein [Roseibium sediminis]|uniref:methyl-accepting chemotaxis protein n=1 Tax=Roseibium sediminis TaxID=1775174 RepID=UPI00123D2FB5|nr:methyl-accepting chemotaxis protein [Roseibium sediminis]
MKLSVGKKLALPVVGLVAMIGAVSSGVEYIGDGVSEQALLVKDYEVPKATLTLTLIEELGDINSNVLEYVNGEGDERKGFDRNYGQFTEYFGKLSALFEKDDPFIQEVASQFELYQSTVRSEVFEAYSPEAEAQAAAEVKRLAEMGRKIETALDDMKNAEIADAANSQTLEEVLTDDLPGVQYYLEMVDEAGDMVSSLNAYLRGDPKAADAFMRDAETFEHFLKLIRPLEAKADETHKLDGIEAAFNEIRTSGPKVFNTYDPASKIKALAAIDRMEHEVFEPLEDRLDEMAQFAIDREQAALTGLVSEIKLSNNLIWLLLGVSVVLGAGTLFFVRQQVTRPLKELQSAMSRLSNGELDVELSGHNRSDEIGEMIRSVEVFRKNAMEVADLQETSRIAEERSQEEKRAAMARLAQEFEQSVGSIVTQVSEAAQSMHSTAGTLTETAEHSKALASGASSSAEQASGNVQTVASAAEELGASIQEISGQVNEQNNKTAHAFEVTKLSREHMQALTRKVSDIGEVLNLITGIAEQTNLLALNATIEAARAGEAGKGFAVVASEVKSLANQTAKATEDIAAQINAVQHETSSTMASIEEIAREIEIVAEIATAIAGAVEEQNAATHEIAKSISHAATGTDLVSQSVTELNGGAEQTGDAARTMLMSASDMSEKVQLLNSMVNKFLTEVRAA